MINSNRIIKILFLAFTFMSMPFTYTEPSTSEQEAQITEQVNDALEKILRDVQKQFCKIDVVLLELAGVVNNNRIAVKNKEAMKKEISVLRDLINSISTEKFVTIDPNNLKMMLNVGQGLTAHLTKALENKFHELPPFNVEKYLQQYRNRLDISFQELVDDVERTAHKIQALEEQAKDAGLTWYNKAFRWAEEKNKGTSDYQWMGRATLIGTLAMATYLYYFYYKNADIHTIHIPGYGPFDFRKYTGYYTIANAERPLNMDPSAFPDGIKRPTGWVDAVNRSIELSNVGKDAIGLGLFGATSYLAYKELPEVKKWLYEKGSKVYAFLRGRTEVKVQMDNGEKEPRFTFKDMVGYEYLKNELMVYVKYIEDPERFDNRKLVPPTGCLIVGPTRTGKSFGAECLAGEIREMQKRTGSKDKVRFFTYGAEAIRAYGLGTILEVAKTKAPCIILIDEIDLLPLQREKGDQLLGEFLAKMSGYLSKESKDQVIVIGITNKPENMDHALRQPGRFEKMIYVGYPSSQERKNFITKKLTELSINPALFDIDKITRETEGKSFEALSGIITTALLKANIKGEVLSQRLLEESFDETIRRITRIEKAITPDEKRLIAVHQAGHAFSHVLIDSNRKLAKVTIRHVIPDIKEENVWDKYWKEAPKLIEHGKMFTYHAFDRLGFDTKTEKLNQAKQLLAGHAAEKIIFGSCGYSYHREDRQIAFEIIKSMVFEGIKPEDYSKQQYGKLLDKVHETLSALEDEVTTLLENNKDKLLLLVKALEKEQTLNEREVEELLSISKPLSPAAQLIAEDATGKAEHDLINGKKSAADLLTVETTEDPQQAPAVMQSSAA